MAETTTWYYKRIVRARKKRNWHQSQIYKHIDEGRFDTDEYWKSASRRDYWHDRIIKLDMKQARSKVKKWNAKQVQARAKREVSA
jgi:hypothetical protein